MPAEKIPDILYKYYSPARWDDTFIKGMIRFSPLPELNDPFEGMPAFSKIYSPSSRRSLKESINITDREILKKIENDGAATELAARIQLKHNFGIFCLTPEPKNMLMWAHYADSH